MFFSKKRSGKNHINRNLFIYLTSLTTGILVAVTAATIGTIAGCGSEDILSLFLPGDRTATPVINPAGGTFDSAVSVRMSSTTPGARIWYTTNNTLPQASVSTAYTGAFILRQHTILRAIATSSNLDPSRVAYAEFAITLAKTAAPQFSPPAGNYSATNVTITSASENARIFYTLDNSSPATNSSEYSAPVLLSSNTTLRAIALASNLPQSDESSAVYTITNDKRAHPVDFFLVVASDSGVHTATNTNNHFLHDPGKGTISVSPDNYGNVYFTLNGDNNNCGIVREFGSAIDINDYGAGGSYSLYMTADYNGWCYSLQGSDPSTPTKPALQRGDNFSHNQISYYNSGVLNNYIKTCLATTPNGTLAIGDETGNVLISSDHGDTISSTAAWSGTYLNHIAIADSGIVVIASGNQLKSSSDGYSQTITLTQAIRNLHFEGETLYVAMENGTVGRSSDYGITVTEYTSGLVSHIIGAGTTKDGRMIAVSDQGRVYLDENDDGNFIELWNLSTTCYEAVIINF